MKFPIHNLVEQLYLGEIATRGFKKDHDTFKRTRKPQRYFERYVPMILWDWDRQPNAVLQLWFELEFLDLPRSRGSAHTADNAHWNTQANTFIADITWEWEYRKRDKWEADIPQIRRSILDLVEHIEANHETLRLVTAAEKEFHRELEKLLKSGVNPNLAANVLFTPLMAAALNADPKAIKLLLDAGANPNQQIAAGGYTALDVLQSDPDPYGSGRKMTPKVASAFKLLKQAIESEG